MAPSNDTSVFDSNSNRPNFHSTQLLMTNDDGFDAQGLKTLKNAGEGLGQWKIIAPSQAWSGLSHSVTSSSPIKLEYKDDVHLSIQGSPADCVRIGLHLFSSASTRVLSGVNQGGNLGVDVYYSGTVAAAREAAIHGYPAIALSQYVNRGRVLDWTTTERWTARVLTLFMQSPCNAGTYWNVNFPHLDPDAEEPEIRFCRLDPSPLLNQFAINDDLATYSASYQQRPRQKNTDVDNCFNGSITITILRI